MHRTLLILSLPVLFWISPAFSSEADLEAKAIHFVQLLSREEFSTAAERFNDKMEQALPVKKLESAWMSERKKMGAFQEIVSSRKERLVDYHEVLVTCQFEKQRLVVKVVYDTSGLVAGLFFLPGARYVYTSPDYVDPETFHSVQVAFGDEDWKLPGTLTVPVGKGPFPAVVLVHGSGPQDRDEKIGPNKPFRDLAEGLSSKGIMVLRYDKRTKAHSRKFRKLKTYTVQEETVTDAQAAVHFLMQRDDVEKTQLFVLGHSLGGMLLPRIAEGVPKTTGFIFLAAPARPLEELMLAQIQYQASLVSDPASKLMALAPLVSFQQQVDAVKALTPTDPQETMILGAPAGYWLDLAAHPQVEAVQKMEQRMLFLQGENDCQVSFEHDDGVWRDALKERKHVTFHRYPDLNHLFMKVEGKSTGREYVLPGNVSADVVNDVVHWIKNP